MAQLYTEAELKAKKSAELIQLALDAGISYGENPTRKEVITDLLTVSQPADDEVDDEEVDDDDELDDEELDESDLDDEQDEVIEAKPVSKATAKKTAAVKKQSAKAKLNEASGEDTLAAKQVAFELGTEAKTLRQFFRSSASTIEPVGSGGRYEFAKSDLPKIKKEFETWRSAHAARGSKRGPKGESKAVEVIDEVEGIDELDDDEELDDEIDDADLELDDEVDD